MEKSEANLREELESMGIFELRTIARSVGVKSPTTSNKANLVQSIINIQNGTMEPIDLTTNKRGRPPRDIKVIGDASAGVSPIELGKDGEIRANHSDDDANNDDKITNKAHKTKKTKDIKHEKDSKPNEPNDNDLGDEGDDEEESDAPKIAVREGWLELLNDGYGFLRAENCENSKNDTYISQKMIKTAGLRRGDKVVAETRALNENKQPAATKILEINGMSPEIMKHRPNFDNLTPIYPEERFRLESNAKYQKGGFADKRIGNDFAIRCIDLIAPIGKGQRAMIVSPPKAGKTTLLKMIANAITSNYPDVEMYVLLVDERPEEVTDMKRSIKGTVIYSTFDETPEHHTKSAELLIERAKRSVEMGKDVVIIMDSLTRLARAYNLTIPPTGRTLSGGIDPGALHSPKRFFGAARNIENGGSLTIIATALVDTGSKMDDVIYEEFKGTGNMEIHLDRKLSEKRIFPAIDINKSGTRREDLLLSPEEMQSIYALRRTLADGESEEATEMFIKKLVSTPNNDVLVKEILLDTRQAQQSQSRIMRQDRRIVNSGYKKV